MEKPPAGKPGRPRSPEPGSSVSTWVPAPHYDRLNKIANARNQSVSAVVRGLIAHSLKTTPG